MIISLVLFLGTECGPRIETSASPYNSLQSFPLLSPYLRIRYRRLSWKTLPSFHIIFGLFALGYALTNNMTVWITQHMDPALYQARFIFGGARASAVGGRLRCSVRFPFLRFSRT